MTLIIGAASSSQASDLDFEYYFKEYQSHYLEDSDPMIKLIERRLAESIFNTSQETEFKRRIHSIQSLVDERPESAQSLRRLNRLLQEEFSDRLKRARQKRWIYTAGGSLVGALIAIPIARGIQAGTQALWIAIPAGALAGGGLGFLLGHLLEMPQYEYSSTLITEDLDQALQSIEDLLK
jgi:hypothetical protein